ncbi:hypothetical protein K1719_023873 [Acacia pycnantha]|nr:hypothetical protein K1719_023873 [Acacia pycnantha]
MTLLPFYILSKSTTPPSIFLLISSCFVLFLLGRWMILGTLDHERHQGRFNRTWPRPLLHEDAPTFNYTITIMLFGSLQLVVLVEINVSYLDAAYVDMTTCGVHVL